MTGFGKAKTWLGMLTASAVFSFMVASPIAQGRPKELDLLNIIDVGPVDIGSCTCVKEPFAMPAFRVEPQWGMGPTQPLNPAPLSDRERLILAGSAAELRADLDRVLALAASGQSAESLRIAFVLATGIDVQPDDTNALAWFLLAARQGNDGAAPVVAYRLLHGIGIDPDPMQAAAWFRFAALRGDPKSMTALGLLHATGQGVPQSFPAAVSWWTKAGEESIAARFLADAYACGIASAPDIDLAVTLYRHLLKSPIYWGAETQLARMHREGCGVEHDAAGAIKLFEMAAQRGDPEAQIELAEMLLNGEGGEQLPNQAYAWASFAALRLPKGAVRDRAEKLRRSAVALLDANSRRFADELIAASMKAGHGPRPDTSANPPK